LVEGEGTSSCGDGDLGTEEGKAHVIANIAHRLNTIHERFMFPSSWQKDEIECEPLSYTLAMITTRNSE
jgi:hypothetical protein